ncbi:d-arabinitol 2-dehydrogenase [Phaffia rhodozyma]|uniref:D-arabinitol 2-dehydrogenase n=1 Tax=Phaffia rhodozyma TaxID=264483 RepID=A0A0F7SJS2_PHARH|nr:d-arabinitol 2-dehydrogenase [Phaffia rhodozyma]
MIANSVAFSVRQQITSTLRASGRVAVTPISVSLRSFSSSLRRFDEKDDTSAGYDAHRVAPKTPMLAAVDDSVRIKVEDLDLGTDLGHRTAGQNNGKHQKRTLASLSFEGKSCVITGAARGLGNVFARTFVESGASQVAIMDLDQADSERAAKEIDDWFVGQGEAKEGELDIVGYGCNVADEEAVQKTFQSIRERFGKIDVLITAAGIVENFPMLEYPTAKINKLWNINVNGTYFCAREAAKYMIQDDVRGSIVMVGSMSSSIVNVPQPQAPYNASKAAVRHLAASMAVELATKGVRVNCLSPGYMLTSLTKTILDRETELRDKWISLTPQGRMGEPEDLKGAVVYLASDAAAYTTGINLKVDGGYSVI